MFERILLTTDGSRGAARAASYGLDLAAHLDASVGVLSVVDTRMAELSGSDGVEAIVERAEASCRAAVEAVGEDEHDLDIDREVRYGVPNEEILAHADETGTDLVVVGTSRNGDERLGSTAERVVSLAKVPVLTVGPGEQSPSLSSLDDIVVPTDGSDPAERAAEHALELAERFGATVHSLYVVDTTVYDLEDAPRSIIGLLKNGGERATTTISANADAINVPSVARVVRGNPAAEVLAYADGVDADLLVMGTRGRSGLPEHLLGSTTRRIVRDTERPVLSVS